MRLYLLRADLDYPWLRPVEGWDWQWRSGAPISFEWGKPKLKLVDEGLDVLVPVDCLGLNAGPDGLVLSDYARAALDGVLGPSGEFWPVEVVGLEYWWFNCLAKVEALDLSATEADWESVSGDWGEFRWITLPRRLVFRPSVLAQAPAVFRVPEFPQGVLFATEAVMEVVARRGLTGFRIDPVWSLAEGGVLNPAGFSIGGAFEPREAGEVERKRAGARAMLDRRAHAGGRR